MIITPTQFEVADARRRQDLLAATARARLVTAATQRSHPAPSRPVGRIRAGLRQAVASLVALASIG